ncbi:MAG TPA: hypothetical protein VFJ58_19095 [Armatimonadota bacterium]|nr:hypothetical protein [Armatimonadota bacterium]
MPGSNNLYVLTGRQVVATFSPTSDATYTASNWNRSTSGGDPFENYNPEIALTPNQFKALTADDTTQSSFSFYTRKADTDAAVTCTADVLCPATAAYPNGQTLPLTATRKLASVKPTAALTLNDPPADMDSAGIYLDQIGLTLKVYEYWWPATITVLAPFVGGTGCFTQLVTSARVNTREDFGTAAATYTSQIEVGNPGVWMNFPDNCIDPTFIYPTGYIKNADGTFTAGHSTWSAGTDMYSFDSPGGTLTPTDVDGGGTKWNEYDVNDSFETWVMYKPPANGHGVVWVPVESLTWSWIKEAGKNDLGVWTLYTLPGDTYNPGDPAATDDPPQWAYSDSTAIQRPALGG